MKRVFRGACIGLLSILIISHVSSMDSILKSKNLRNFSDKVKISVCWHWLAGNVSTEAALKICKL